jgi:hypothetical protein
LQRERNGKAERLGGLQVDDQLKFRRLLEPRPLFFCAGLNQPDGGRGGATSSDLIAAANGETRTLRQI